ncbi:MAG: hypothetical protein ACI8PZ_004925 [Myxococcota bacterium]|jgi:hypothetical protein
MLTRSTQCLVLALAVSACTDTDTDTGADADDPSNGAGSCDPWYEGTPCVRMTEKWSGTFAGGFGACGTSYDFEFTERDTPVNGLALAIIWTGGFDTHAPFLYEPDLASSTEFLMEYEADGSRAEGRLAGKTFIMETYTIDDELGCVFEGTLQE